MVSTMISRRNFVFGAVSLAATLLGSCRGPKDDSFSTEPSPPTSLTPTVLTTRTAQATRAPISTPTPTLVPSPTAFPKPQTVNVWVDPTSPVRFRPTAERLIAQIAAEALTGPVNIERVQSTDQADISFMTTMTTEPTTSRELAKTYLVPICSPRIPIRGVTSEEVTAMLDGSTSDWSAVGSLKSVAVEPFVIDGLILPGTTSSAIRVATYEDMVAQFSDHPGAIALAAIEDVDFRATSLIVNGQDLIAAAESPKEWPFSMVLYVTGEQEGWKFVEALTLPASDDTSMSSAAPPLTVTFVGDVILGRTVHTIMTRLNDYSAPFRLVADELKKSDLTIANLECSLSDHITPPTDPFTFSFMTFTAGADGLALAGVDAVTQANNHSMNFGAQGMRDTLAALDQRKIRHFGIGENLTEARQPVIFETNGRRIAILGYDGITGTTYGATDTTAGTAPLDVELMAEDIAAVRQKADIVVPFVHWGIEYQLVPSEVQRSIAKNAIDVGADMVIGSHCHWVQGMEIYNGKPIIYSLANFVFDQDWSLETKQGLIMHLVFRSNGLAAIRFVPVLIEDFYRPRIVDGSQMSQILDRIWQSTDLIQANT